MFLALGVIGTGAAFAYRTYMGTSRSGDPPIIRADNTPTKIIAAVPALKAHRADILGRAMLCKRTSVFPIECVIRGYLSGSAWKEYAASGTLAGEKLPAGLVESEKLNPAIFSPATKAETGHDENITIARMREVVGDETAHTLESMTRATYSLGEELALYKAEVAKQKAA